MIIHYDNTRDPWSTMLCLIRFEDRQPVEISAYLSFWQDGRVTYSSVINPDSPADYTTILEPDDSPIRFREMVERVRAIREAEWATEAEGSI